MKNGHNIALYKHTQSEKTAYLNKYQEILLKRTLILKT